MINYNQIREQEYKNVTARFCSPKEKESVVLAKEIMKQMGFYILPEAEKTITPTAKREDIQRHSDAGDIHFHMAGEKTECIAEVKRHESVLHWTGMEDYPYRNFFIDGCSQFDHKKSKPSYYFVFNKDLTSFALVDVFWTINRWKRIRKPSINGYPKYFYQVELKYVNFFKTNTFLG